MSDRMEYIKRYTTRAKRRKKIIRRVAAILLTVIITALAVFLAVKVIGLIKGVYYNDGFTPAPYGAKVSEKVEKAKTLQLPDWVDMVDIQASPWIFRWHTQDIRTWSRIGTIFISDQVCNC